MSRVRCYRAPLSFCPACSRSLKLDEFIRWCISELTADRLSGNRSHVLDQRPLKHC